MNNLKLIIAREFSTRVRKKSFILITLLFPLIYVAIAMIPALLSKVDSSETQTICVIDRTQSYHDVFQDTPNCHFKWLPATASPKDYESSNPIIHITANLIDHPDSIQIYTKESVSPAIMDGIQARLNAYIRQQKVAALGKTPEELRLINSLDTSTNIAQKKWTDNGETKDTDNDATSAVGMVFTFLIYLFVMIYGGMVMQSVMEEKTNRVVELIVSTVKPFDLMVGKVIGIGLVGLLQMFIWIGIFVIGTSAFYHTAVGADFFKEAEIFNPLLSLPWFELVTMFLLMFIGGYLFYASFFAAVGASISEQKDVQQFTVPVTLILIFALYAGMYSSKNPDGPLAFWSSIFPLTAPVVIMVRIGFGVPLWQEILSVVLVYLSAFFMLWVAGRIYRIGILIYGKKPSLKDMVRWFFIK